MKLRQPEILCVSVGFVSALGSFAWFGFFAQKQRNVESIAGHTAIAAPAYQRNTYDPRLPSVVQWSPPPVQSRNGEWVYEVFTPPEIFYDAKLERFAVTPPVTRLATEPSDVPDGNRERLADLQLIEVKQTLFRLQLIGHVKTGNECIGLFENRVTGEVLLAPKQRSLPELGLAIETIDLRRSELSESGDTAASQPQAVACIRDLTTGELITLSTAGRCFAPSARATLGAFNSSPTEREVGEGDVWEIEGVMYEIDKIHVSPAAVVIKRRGDGRSHDERFTLSLVGAKSPENPVPSL